MADEFLMLDFNGQDSNSIMLEDDCPDGFKKDEQGNCVAANVDVLGQELEPVNTDLLEIDFTALEIEEEARPKIEAFNANYEPTEIISLDLDADENMAYAINQGELLFQKLVKADPIINTELIIYKVDMKYC